MSILRSCLVGVAVAGVTATSALAVSLDTVISLKTTHDQSKTYIDLFHKPFNKNNPGFSKFPKKFIDEKFCHIY